MPLCQALPLENVFALEIQDFSLPLHPDWESIFNRCNEVVLQAVVIKMCSVTEDMIENLSKYTKVAWDGRESVSEDEEGKEGDSEDEYDFDAHYPYPTSGSLAAIRHSSFVSSVPVPVLASLNLQHFSTSARQHFSTSPLQLRLQPIMSLAPPVAAWVQNALSEILNATMQPAFDRAFDACFAADVAVVRNGAALSRRLQNGAAGHQVPAADGRGAVPWGGQRERGAGAWAAGDRDGGGFFEAQLRQGEPGGRPWQLNILTTSFIANVDNDASVVPDPPITDFDARRISKFTIVDRVRVIPF
ncbi:hypothetical protein PLEOSDRAFT_1108305 [Pleurotus ostreatus PC15]|uniref:Uncharacterized protein n=1 Tax=Pleurotus ostreatus (strain PC15) TaxID=1137138 RepID=A0A067N757_PLEO1|nr:hypothetical protein PLEOSDRAFT_1108305 [Pleurotus ostreatus PC15]